MLGALWIGMVGVAHAWDAGEARLVAAVPPPSDVAVAMLDGAAALVATGPGGTAVVDAATGRILAEADLPGVALLVADVDGDGDEDLVHCGAGGVARLSWDLGASVVFSDGPCRAIAARTSAGVTEVVVVDEALRALRIKGDAVASSASLARVPAGEVWLDAYGGAVVYAPRDATVVTEIGPRGTSTFATGAPIGGLARGPITWAWTVPGTATVEDVTGRATALDAHPGALAAADLDRDGAMDLVVAHGDERIGVLLADGVERRMSTPARAERVRVAELDGDGCADLVAWSPGRSGVAAAYGVCAEAQPLLAGGGVRVEGDARTVWLESAVGRFPEGEVPPGIYQVRAWFGESKAVPAGVVSVPEGGPVTLRCNAAMMRCVRVEP